MSSSSDSSDELEGDERLLPIGIVFILYISIRIWKENKYDLATDGNANNQIKTIQYLSWYQICFQLSYRPWCKFSENKSNLKEFKFLETIFVAIWISSFAYCDSLHWRSRAIDSFCHETIIITMQLLITQITYVSLVNKIFLFNISETIVLSCWCYVEMWLPI